MKVVTPLELIINDTGDNENFEMYLNGEKLDANQIVGYELKRTAGKITQLIVKYNVRLKKININSKKTQVKSQVLK